ncbi:MAG: hypothetical protein KDA96_24530, partial [Planctomycetaceae bacterium]|nr:hypothetical protein [Planctomycetaceae bacterium]
MHSLQRSADRVIVPDDEPTDEVQLCELTLCDLDQVRSEFEDRTRQVFRRFVVGGLATDLVASEFDMSRASVRPARSRVLRRL